jgi:hypothetical protein
MKSYIIRSVGEGRVGLFLCQDVPFDATIWYEAPNGNKIYQAKEPK